MNKRSEIVKTAHDFLGTKWVHQGRRPDAVDCAGLIVLVGLQCGVMADDFVDTTNYNRLPNGFEFRQIFETHGQYIPFNNVQDGDIAIFGQGVYACHCGILFYENGALFMIHAYNEVGKVVKEPFTRKWRKLLKGTYKYKGV